MAKTFQSINTGTCIHRTHLHLPIQVGRSEHCHRHPSDACHHLVASAVPSLVVGCYGSWLVFVNFVFRFLDITAVCGPRTLMMVVNNGSIRRSNGQNGNGA